MYVTIPTTYDNMANDLRHGWTYVNDTVISPEGIVYPVAASFAATLATEGYVDRGYILSRMCLGLHKKRPIPLIEGSTPWREARANTDEITDEIPMSELVPGWKYRSISGETFIWLGDLYVKEFKRDGNVRNIVDHKAKYRLKIGSFTSDIVKTTKIRAIAVLEQQPFPEVKLHRPCYGEHWANPIYSRNPIPQQGVLSTDKRTPSGEWHYFQKIDGEILAVQGRRTRKVILTESELKFSQEMNETTSNNPVNVYLSFGKHTVMVHPPTTRDY